MSIQETNLKAIANAIREKEGSSGPIPAKDFPERIRAISAIPAGLRTISLTADPPEGGTVSGGGLALDGMTVTIKAEATSGYEFGGWKEEGGLLTPDTSYTFDVDRDRNLIAVLSERPQIPDTLNECTWEQISQLSQSGEFASHFKVGDTKTIVLNGQIGVNGIAANNLSIDLVVVGIDHNADIESSGEHRVHFKLGNIGGTQAALVDSKYNATVSAVGYFSMNRSRTNSGGWKETQMREHIMGGNGTPENPTESSLMAALPADLRAVMKPVQKWTDNVAGGTSVAANVTATTEYLCPAAEFEVFGARTGANSTEQTKQKQYDYYKESSKLRYKHNALTTVCYVRLRSPHYGNTGTSFCTVNTSGASGSSMAEYSLGVEALLFV